MITEWELDSTTGYYYNESNGFYYDSNSGFYYSDAIGTEMDFGTMNFELSFFFYVLAYEYSLLTKLNVCNR